MFRNTYIQNYKNSIRDNSTVQMMLCHVNHIYAALGCVIQDIQFMVGNLMISHEQQVKKQRMSMPGKLKEPISVNQPKAEFLPSSSYKYQVHVPTFDKVEKLRSNQQELQQLGGSSKKNSFDEMFPNAGSSTKLSADADGRKKERYKDSKVKVPEESQEDFMDYLFKKGKK